ncbi:DNA-directed RNA polymerase, subunit 2 [Artemisia annua]|uniref:DNA-directed RNA polymerase, subunit 2 n=1 Tax=Artemisia annua TaxID=35608 RepID=A0A2U1MPR8_ARTAN|nr:DNA-directed RNA polymerase, subunit 2 [Artemisia annua]
MVQTASLTTNSWADPRINAEQGNHPRRVGFTRWGNERLCDGRTGENLHERLFTHSDCSKMHDVIKVNVTYGAKLLSQGLFRLDLPGGEMRGYVMGELAKICTSVFSLTVIVQKCMYEKMQENGECDPEDVIKVNVTYGAKLLSQGLFSMSISLRS